METGLHLGGIYKTNFDERPFRIIGLDNYQIFYDCLWSDNKWTFSGNFKSKSIFYRMSALLFKTRSELIEIKELNEIEYKYFRTDLPMRFGRAKQLNWNRLGSDELKFLESTFSNHVLSTNKIILEPFRLKGKYHKGIVIESEKNLTEFEIIEKAIFIQQSLNNHESNGIGFYRLGYEKGLPRYSIGQYFEI